MSKDTGIRRKIDELGRIVIPIEIRNKLGIETKDSIEIYVENSRIVLKKYEPSCLFCGDTKELSKYKDRIICNKCIHKIGEKINIDE